MFSSLSPITSASAVVYASRKFQPSLPASSSPTSLLTPLLSRSTTAAFVVDIFRNSTASAFVVGDEQRTSADPQQIRSSSSSSNFGQYLPYPYPAAIVGPRLAPDVGQPKLVNVAVLLLLAKIAWPPAATLRSSPDYKDEERAFIAPSSKRVRRERPFAYLRSGASAESSSVRSGRLTAAKIAAYPASIVVGGGTSDAVVAAAFANRSRAFASGSDSASGGVGGGSSSGGRRTSGDVSAGGTANIARLRRQTVPSRANGSGADEISASGGDGGAVAVAASAAWNTTTLTVDATTVAQPELIADNRSPNPMTPNGASMETGESHLLLLSF